MKKYHNFDLTEAQKDNLEAAVEAIKAKIIRPIFVDWLDFFSTNQVSSESIDDYASRLKNMARPCKFAALEEELVTYKIVTSNKWTQLRSKMLGMQDLTTEKAVDICRVGEIAEK